MEKLHNPAKIPNNTVCLLDTDILINWLTQEVDLNSDKNLWEAPHQIIKLIEDKKIKGFISIINLLEIRFVLRRKKDFTEQRIKEDVAKILEIIEVIIPDEIDLLRANNLQTKNPLGPFDAILVAVGLSLKEAKLISRDKSLLGLAAKFLSVFTPEEFLSVISKK